MKYLTWLLLKKITETIIITLYCAENACDRDCPENFGNLMTIAQIFKRS